MFKAYATVVLQSIRAGIKYRARLKAECKLQSFCERTMPLQLDLGAGGPGRPGTVGIDLSGKADLVWDLTDGIPCEKDTVTAIFSDHFFEHLQLVDVLALLKECHRVLTPGGRLRFTVPHIDPYVAPWLRGDFHFINSKITDVPHGQEDLYLTPFDRISWLLLRDGEHRSLFDRESILHKVRLAGFEQVSIDNFKPDLDRNPRFSSIYVEAFK